MKLATLYAAILIIGAALPATAQVFYGVPAMPSAVASACRITEQWPDAAKLVTIAPNGVVSTTRLAGGDSTSMTRVCEAGP
ncbi:MAG TPA: hypothetical protein VME41_08010 [Stellaceae bacterium]|nr:hypothetical protein [Stellaceae bacterium]